MTRKQERALERACLLATAIAILIFLVAAICGCSIHKLQVNPAAIATAATIANAVAHDLGVTDDPELGALLDLGCTLTCSICGRAVQSKAPVVSCRCPNCTALEGTSWSPVYYSTTSIASAPATCGVTDGR